MGRLVFNGGFCTATLIRDNLILTAAHYVYRQNGQSRDAREFIFSAGLRGGHAEATRGVNSLVALPDYEHIPFAVNDVNVAHDIAVLRLDQVIQRADIQPFRIDEQPVRGDEIGVVSYGVGRSEAPILQEVCSVLERQTGGVLMTCDVVAGFIGSPVFTLGESAPRIVSVVSAVAPVGDDKVSLGASLKEPLQTLLSHYAAIGPARPSGWQVVVRTGERNDTGAKFVRL
ncbi:trypsin-like serine peptidase [Cognatiyoonia sp.]|uniref:trypsin-like serine peptidase n=1 Tax=Cognatiyoonia sp. TaxID=2211652 RepID=UPI003F6966EA